MSAREPNLLRRAAEIAQAQLGVITRRQLLLLGFSRRSVDSLGKGGGWRRISYGLYTTTAGTLPWITVASGALLICRAPAGLGGLAGAYAHNVIPKPPQRIEVHSTARTRYRIPGVTYHQRTTLGSFADWNQYRLKTLTGLPPTTLRTKHLRAVPLAHLVLDLATTMSELDFIGLLTNAIREGLSPGELRHLAENTRRRTSGKRVLKFVATVEDGVESPLEYSFDEVMAGHGLPVGRRQKVHHHRSGMIRVDRDFEEFHLRVELDGVFYHRGLKADADVMRDNEAASSHGTTTLRFRWSHVIGQPCSVARQVAVALRHRGWRGHVRYCGPDCQLN